MILQVAVGEQTVACDVDTSKNLDQTLSLMVSRMAQRDPETLEYFSEGDKPISLKKRPSELNLCEMDTLTVR